MSEIDALRTAIESTAGTRVTLHLTRAKQILAALEAAREDAERWRHARKLLTVDDIERAQQSHDHWNGLVSEDMNLKADAAIDQARGKGVKDEA